MSYRVTVEIVCDREGCPNGLVYESTNKGGLNKTWAAYKASHIDGWHVRGKDPKVAYCPAHRPENRYLTRHHVS